MSDKMSILSEQIWGLNLIKSLIIILAVLLYWKFVYFKYHKAPWGPLNFVFFIGIFSSIGAYAFFSESVVFQDFKNVFIVYAAFYFISTLLVYTAYKKHGLTSKIEITYSWIYWNFGKSAVYFVLILIYPALFFTIAGSRLIFGPEYIIIWILIFFAWIRSDIKIVRNYIFR